MSKEQQNDKPQKKKPEGAPNNVVALPARCPAEGCGKKAERSSFCSEHFEWFKAGLISRDGAHPKDFDKKYQAWARKNQKKVA